MDPDVRTANAAVDPKLRNGRPRHGQYRGDDVHLRKRSADERDGHGVRSGVAALQTSSAVVRVAWSRVVMVGSERVVMLGMVVVVVGVRVQRPDNP